MQSSHMTQLEAEVTLEYLTSQLRTNHAISSKRYDVLYKSPQTTWSEEQRLSFAWAKYAARLKNTGRTGHGSTLEFSFDPPTLSFICDHDALLTIHINSILNLDREGTESFIPGPPFATTFRVPTEWRSILGNDLKIGDHESRIRLLVFDFEHVTVDAALLESIGTKDIDEDTLSLHDLKRVLTGYLRALQDGGHHVLFSSPEFNDDEFRPSVSFSLLSSSTKHLLREINGYTDAMINGYLSLLWYSCYFVVRDSGRTNWDDTTSLAEYRTWLSVHQKGEEIKWYCYLKFGAPKVRILCAREVILVFQLTEVAFSDSADEDHPVPDYEDWQIALIVDVEAHNRDIAILPSSAHHSRKLSVFPTEAREEHVIAQELLIDFFVKEYIVIVRKAGLRELVRDQRIRVGHSVTVEADGSWWMLERDSSTSGLNVTIRHTKTQHFDVIMAISQTSLNNQIRIRLSTFRDLMHWESNSILLEIKSVTVRMLNSFQDGSYIDGSAGKAIIMVNISEGSLRMKDGDEATLISACCIAYEVEMLESSHRDLPNNNYENKPYVEPHVEGTDSRYELRHIYLNLKNARPSPIHMFFDESYYDDDTDMSRRAQRFLIDKIAEEYFAALMQHGVHVLATVPVYQAESLSTFHRFTSMAFRTYADESYDLGQDISSDGPEHAEAQTISRARSEGILFVFGMTGTASVTKVYSFKPSAEWIVHASAGFSHGTFAISRSTFIMRLHTLLARVNALTTLIPVSPSYDSQDADIVLRWADHKDFNMKQCKWKSLDAEDELLANSFEWKYHQDWRRHETGSNVEVKGDYTISCTTENRLELPDVDNLSNGSLEIKMSGNIQLRVASAQSDSRWSTESSAFWHVSISVKTVGRGLVKVDIDGLDDIRHPPPKNTTLAVRRGSGNIPDAYTILKKNLPRKKDFDNVLQELKELEGAWHYYYPNASAFTLCSPMFNLDGDLLFELRRMQTSFADMHNGRRGSTTTRFTDMHIGRPATPTTNGGPRPVSPYRGASSRPSSPALESRPSSPIGSRPSRPSSPIGSPPSRPSSRTSQRPSGTGGPGRDRTGSSGRTSRSGSQPPSGAARDR